MYDLSLGTFSVILLLGFVNTDTCYHSSTGSSYCNRYCSGSYGNQYCNIDNISYASATFYYYIGPFAIGEFIGLIIGCVAGLAIIIAVIVGICVLSIRSAGQKREVVHPATSVSVVQKDSENPYQPNNSSGATYANLNTHGPNHNAVSDMSTNPPLYTASPSTEAETELSHKT